MARGSKTVAELGVSPSMLHRRHARFEEKDLLAVETRQRRSIMRQPVADYINKYCNLVRLHSHRGYVSLVEFATKQSSKIK